jgi:homoserine O-acetyltransferase
MTNTPIPVTGAWLPGDPAGTRQFFTFATDRRFALDSGTTLSDVTVAFETWETLNDDASKTKR